MNNICSLRVRASGNQIHSSEGREGKGREEEKEVSHTVHTMGLSIKCDQITLISNVFYIIDVAVLMKDDDDL